MARNYDIERDLKEAEAMVAALEDYVQHDQLYARVHGGGLAGMPSMTAGSLLMRLRRLDVLHDDLSMDQRKRLKKVMRHNESVAEEWRFHYSKKLIREAISRLDTMRMFFQECKENPRTCRNNYHPEALRRTIVEEIWLALRDLNVDEDEDLKMKRGMIDQQLRNVLVNTDFIWSDKLEAAYPAGEFWWLHQMPIEAP